jgi:hypothetical protein
VTILFKEKYDIATVVEHFDFLKKRKGKKRKESNQSIS